MSAPLVVEPHEAAPNLRWLAWSMIVVVTVGFLLAAVLARPLIEQRITANQLPATHSLILPVANCPPPAFGQALVVTLLPSGAGDGAYTAQCRTIKRLGV